MAENKKHRRKAEGEGRMIGLSKSQAERIISRPVRTISDSNLRYIIDEVIEGIAKAIEDNNNALERDIDSLVDQKIREISQ
ncbi:MAG: hypothetical protein Q7J73_07975 [Dehalococcoidales bacterium]|nr:hypothetical protein [Dehalococcoidales bacterium]